MSSVASRRQRRLKHFETEGRQRKLEHFEKAATTETPRDRTKAAQTRTLREGNDDWEHLQGDGDTLRPSSLLCASTMSSTSDHIFALASMLFIRFLCCRCCPKPLSIPCCSCKARLGRGTLHHLQSTSTFFLVGPPASPFVGYIWFTRKPYCSFS